jgi:hypothetical protein
MPTSTTLPACDGTGPLHVHFRHDYPATGFTCSQDSSSTVSCADPRCTTWTDEVHYVVETRDEANGPCMTYSDVTTTTDIPTSLNDGLVEYSFEPGHMCTSTGIPAPPDSNEHVDVLHDPSTGEVTLTTTWSVTGVCNPPQVVCCPTTCPFPGMTCYRAVLAAHGDPPPVCPP